MIEREWPPGHRLFSEGDLHLAFDPPEGKRMPAILCKINAAAETLTVLRIKIFDSDEKALAWFAAERLKRAQ